MSRKFSISRLVASRAVAPSVYGRVAIGTRILIALILLTAGALKLYGVRASAVPGPGWFASQQALVGTSLWEIMLGLWLLSGANSAGPWLAATVTFLAFAGVSAHMGWTGEVSCGCLGSVTVSPWYAFAADTAALVLLAVGRPDFRARCFKFPYAAVRVTACALAVLLGLAGVASWIYGSP